MTKTRELLYGDLRLDVANARIWQGQATLKLTPKAFAVLCYLLEHAGQLVTKDELLSTIWTEAVVSEGVLTTCMREIRQALRDTAKTPHYIETVHRRGYRFIATVR